MRRLAPFSLAVACIALATAPARADDCVADDGRGRPFVTCFDPGQRLYLQASTAGLGGGVQLRQHVATDDPRIHYRLEHTVMQSVWGASRYDVSAYTLRLLRHSDSGFLVLPTRPPRQISIPFDLGFEASALRLEGLRRETEARVGVVRVALLADLSRSNDGRLRLGLGPLMRWDATVDFADKVAAAHDVSPFTMLAVSAYTESKDGLSLARLTAEAGYQRNQSGFHQVARFEAMVERVVVGVNDHPLSVFAGVRYDDEPRVGLRGEVGLRFALLTGKR